MTPELRELLKRHPAPWKTDGCFVLNATNNLVIDMWLGCSNHEESTAIAIVELVNDYAARISAGERFISGGGDG